MLQTLLNDLLGHWLIKPLKSYDHIYQRVGVSSRGCRMCATLKLIVLRAQWLHLGVYVTDPVARTVVNKFLSQKIGQMKGTFRKEVCKLDTPRSVA